MLKVPLIPPPKVVPELVTLEKSGATVATVGVGIQVYDSYTNANPSGPSPFEIKERILSGQVDLAQSHANTSCEGIKCITNSCKTAQTNLATVQRLHCEFILSSNSK